MKKILLFIYFLVFVKTSIFAQNDNIILSLNCGYSTAVLKNSIETFTESDIINDSYYLNNKKFSLGQSINIYADFGIPTSNIISLHLGYKYGFLSKVKFNELTAIGTVILDKQRTLNANRSSFIPAIQLSTDNNKLNTFIRIGASFNFINQRLNEFTELDTNTLEHIWEYDGNPNIGFFAMWGLQYNISQKIAINFNLNFEAINYTPTSSSISKVIENGIENSDHGLLPIESEIEFTDWVEDQYSQNPDINKPLKLSYQTFSYSCIGFNLGVSFFF